MEIHQENLEKLIQLMKKSEHTQEEDKNLKLAAGDGLVAMIEASWEVGAEIYGIELKKEGYTIYESDYKTGLEGKFWKVLEKAWSKIHGYFDRKAEKNPRIVQSSFWAPKLEAIRRWIWKHECFPAYKRVSLEREEFYASRLIELEKDKGDYTKILFFVGYGHKWNTLKEMQARKKIEI